MIKKTLPLAALATALAPFMLPSLAQAATVDFSLNSLVVVQGVGGDSDAQDQFTPVPVLGNETASVLTAVGGSQATAGFAINQQTGAIKFGASSDLTASNLNFTSQATSSVDLTLREDLVISGTGDVTFRLNVEGALASGTPAVNGTEIPTVSASMQLLIDNGAGPNVFRSDDLFLAGTVNDTIAVDETLEFSITLDAASIAYQFVLDLASTSQVLERQGSSGFSSADFFNTAFLSIEADDTITVTASDPLFLAGDASGPVSQVPLPATAWMFIAALAGLGLIQKRQAHS